MLVAGLLATGCSPNGLFGQGARPPDTTSATPQGSSTVAASRDESADRARRGDHPPRTPDIKPEVIPDQAANAYRAIEEATSRIRGLKPTRDVELRFMSQAELRQYFLDSFNREYTPDERARDQKLLTMLGLLRPDQDLATLMLNVLSEQVIGFYDDDTRRMYLIGDVVQPTPSAKVTFSHEFTHALQDEFFGLKALEPRESQDDDRSAAVQALVEGDATLVMTLYARDELSLDERRRYALSQSGGAGTLEDAPLVLREELLFPYSEGLRFVQTLYRQGGFPTVDTAFRNPPQSTEQIIHPNKYLSQEAPEAVVLPDLASPLGGNWRHTASNTLGELDVRILVEQYTDRQTAERAAAGWAGDRYALLEDAAGRSAVAIKTTWDSPEDASKFFKAYSQAIRNRLGSQARQLASEPARLALAGTAVAAEAELQNREVLLVIAPEEVLSTVAQSLAGR